MRVLFYDDAPDFGGHELQTLAAVRYIASQPDAEVGFIFYRGNARLAKQIADLAAQCPRVRPLPQDDASRQFQFLRTLFSGHAIRRIAASEKVARSHSMPVFERAFLAALLSVMGRLKRRPKTN